MANKKAVLAAVFCLLTATVTAANLCVPTAKTVVASATDTKKLTYGDLTYKIVDDDHIEITACTNTAETIEIPSEIDDLPVTVIAATAFFRTNVTAVTIPDSITTIGGGAFWHCQKLTTVNIPSSVTSIENHAFADCPLLAELDIPETVTYIGANAFELTAWIEAKKEENPFVIVNGVVLDASKVIDNILDERNSAKEKEQARQEEEGIILIHTNDHEEVEPFTIEFPEGITGIGESVFEDFKHAIYVEEIIIPEGVTTIGKDAFSLCQECYRIVLPSTVMEVGDKAFDTTPWLSKHPKTMGMFIVNGLLINADEAEGDVEIPDTVKTICGYAFKANEAITSVTIHDGCTAIGKQAFKKCTNLKSVTLPNTLEIVQEEAFCESALESLTIPAGVKEVAYRSFITIKELKEVTVLEDNLKIGEQAFGYLNTFTLTGQYTHIYVLTKSEGFAIKCHEGSTAEAYAKANELTAITNTAGDVNGDMKVSIADAVLLERYLEEIEGVSISASGLKAADMNGDGVHDASDTTLILKKIARMTD